MRTAAVIAVLLAGALQGSGCALPEADDQHVVWLDFPRYVAEVQPVLAARCGNPSCHGRPDRPFSIYSPLQWRADPARTYLREPLSEAELVANHAVACVLVTGAAAPEEALLLRKALGDAAGTYHGGGAAFDGPTDRDYRTVLGWIEAGWVR
jgi:hypothetical protein